MSDEVITAFPPILPETPHTLILGTMPGGKSLAANQYYAPPQNQFWKFMGAIYGAGPELAYEDRIKILKAKGVAVWDVLNACTRAVVWMPTSGTRFRTISKRSIGIIPVYGLSYLTV